MILRAKTLLHKMTVAGLVLISWFAIAVAEGHKVHSDVTERVAREGNALVLVGLKMPWQTEGTLGKDAVLAQRRAIRAAQNDLLSELDGTKHRIVRQYLEIPGIALEIGRDALSVLNKSLRVTNVLPDRPAGTLASVGPTAESAPSPPTSKNTPAQDGKVPQGLFEKAKSTGTVLVLVGLKAPWRPERRLSQEMVRVQRDAIAAAQNYLLTEIAATRHRVIRLYKKIPGIALEVGLEALKILARSAAVTNVLQDRPAKSAK